jgi:hypothetical protein
MARVALNKKAFFINKQGTRITPTFDSAFDFHEGLAAVEVGDKVGYIHRDGSFAIPPVHHSASGLISLRSCCNTRKRKSRVHG